MIAFRPYLSVLLLMLCASLAWGQTTFSLEVSAGINPVTVGYNWSSVQDCVGPDGAGKVTCFYQDGVRKSETHWENQVLHGELRTWHPNARLKESATVDHGLLTGTSMQYWENGKPRAVADWQKGMLHGQLKVYDEDGNLTQQSNWREGLMEGELLAFHPNGEVVARYQMQADKPVDKIETFYPSGKKQTLVNLVNHLPEDTVYTYHENGQVAAWEIYRKGNREHLSKSFYADGTPASIFHWKGGEVHGSVTMYYPSGQKKSKVIYELGEPIGPARYWTESGAVTTVYPGSKDRQKAKIYNDAGQLIQEKYYEGLEQTGFRVFSYDATGRLEGYATFDMDENLDGLTTRYLGDGGYEEVRFRDDVKDGPSTLYWAKDRVRTESVYRGGLLVGEQKQYHENGTLFAITEFNEGQRHGRAATFHENGRPASTAKYVKGLRVGVYQSWHPNGKNHESGEYKMGFKIGEWFNYFDDGKLNLQAEYDRKGYLKAPAQTFNREGKLIARTRDEGDLRYHESLDEEGSAYRRMILQRGEGEYTLLRIENFEDGEWR